MFRRRTIFNVLLRRKYYSNVVRRHSIEDVLSNVRAFESIPRLPGFPLLGNWHLYKFGTFNGDKYHKALKQMYESYGPLVVEQIGWKEPILHVFEPADVQTIFKNEDKTPYIHPLMEATHINRQTLKYISPGFGHTNGEEWYRLVCGIRKLMMRPNSMQEYLPMIVAVTDKTVEQMKRDIDTSKRIVKNLKTILGKWNLQNSSTILFEDELRDCDAAASEDVYRKVSDANQDAFQLNRVMKFSLPFYKYWTTPTAWRQSRREKCIYKIIKYNLDRAVEKVNKGLKDETLKKDDYLFLINLMQNDFLTKEDLMAVTVSIMLDGLYTVVPVLLSTIYALANNPDVQEKTFDEIRTVCDDSKSLTKDMLNDLVYLKAVVKETFRMYPNGVELARITKKPLVLSGYYVPAETHLTVNMLVHFRNEDYFPDPDVFKPERWLRNDKNSIQCPIYVQSPFGIGARTCVGRRLSEVCIYAFLFRILQEFQLKLPSGNTEPEYVFNTLLMPVGESPVQFHRRLN